MSTLRILSLVTCGAALAAAAVLAACDTETATQAVIDNGYATLADGGDPTMQTVVYRGWWQATYFPDAVAAGSESSEYRTVPGSDTAYALLAVGWDPSSTTPPTVLIPVMSKAEVAVQRGDVLHITVSDQTFNGNCAGSAPLSQDQADFITQRIFPGPFTNMTYDAKTCTLTPLVDADAGVEGGTDAGADAADAADGH